jgi:hypothetical protein
MIQFYNTGHIYYPGCPIQGIQFYKQINATHAKELVSVPSKRAAITFKAFGIHVSVVICLDLLDFSSIARIVQQGETDLLLVPAYIDNIKHMMSSAQIISKALIGTVAVVNRYETKRSCLVYRYGEEVPSGEFQRHNFHPSGEINVLEINVDDCRERKFSGKGHWDSNIASLFGLDPAQKVS